MTLVDGVWYDNEIGKFPLFPKDDLQQKQVRITHPHELGLEANSDGIMIVKCIKCHISRMFIVGHDIYNCNK